MTNILLTVSYDGTDFCGWQRQDASKSVPEMRTVQGEIEKALEKLLKTKVDLQGSGRTDSGVHAFGQVANFISPIDSIPAANYVRALNSFLPQDVRVNESREVAMDFSSRFNATSRTYRYFILPERVPYASETRFVWSVPHRPNVDVLDQMAHVMKGEMDFATFTAAGDQSISTHRYVDDARFYMDGDKIVFQIQANAFLWKMVRSLTGTLIQMEKNGLGPEDFRRVLESHDRKQAGITAPPTGLFLYRVDFDGVRRHI